MNIGFSSQNLKQRYFQLRNKLKYTGIRKQKIKEIRDKYAHNPSLGEFNLNDDLNNKIKIFWGKFGFKVDTMWQQAYISVNGIEDHRYIPEDIFYIFIEPNLNRKDLYRAYVDKNNYDKVFAGFKIPRTILRNVNGKYYDGNYEKIKVVNINDFLKRAPGDYIVKPSIESSGAKNVMRLQSDSQKIFINGKHTTFETVEKIIKRDFLVQEFLEQHQILKNIYPCSLNTFRVVTLRMGGDIHVLQSIVKFGDKGNFVDFTVNLGGLHCGVKDDGTLNPFAVDLNYKKYYTHPYTGYSFEHVVIPQFPSLLNFTKNLHRCLLYFDMASWDIAIDKNGEAALIESNLIYQGFSFLQVHNGPLFGNFTDKLLEEKLTRY